MVINLVIQRYLITLLCWHKLCKEQLSSQVEERFVC